MKKGDRVILTNPDSTSKTAGLKVGDILEYEGFYMLGIGIFNLNGEYYALYTCEYELLSDDLISDLTITDDPLDHVYNLLLYGNGSEAVRYIEKIRNKEQ